MMRIQKLEAISRRSPVICPAVVMVLMMAFSVPASATLTAKANHDHVKIDFFYNGSTVGVSGEADPGTDLIVKISSPEGHEILKQKGKSAGFLWMNVGTLMFEKVPNLYWVHATRKPEDILTREELDANVLGYVALKRHVEISPVSDEREKDNWFAEFVKYKETSKLYAESNGRISTSVARGRQLYRIKTDWPYQAPPGDYIVTVYAVKDGRVVEKAEDRVKVEQVGVVKYLSGMAKDRAAAYGFLSIAAALGAGFGVGMVFRKGGGAH